jgi:hypothetical protein
MSRIPNAQVTKDPSSDEPYGVDWTAYLAELGVGVTIAASTWAITGTDAVLTKHDDTVILGSLKTQLFLAAGTNGRRYTVTNHITTNSSPAVIDERSFYVLVENQ